jgi:hypothetical protein
MIHRIWVLAFLVLAIGGFLAGCGGKPEKAAVPTQAAPPPPAEETEKPNVVAD